MRGARLERVHAGKTSSLLRPSASEATILSRLERRPRPFPKVSSLKIDALHEREKKMKMHAAGSRSLSNSTRTNKRFASAFTLARVFSSHCLLLFFELCTTPSDLPGKYAPLVDTTM